jgi:hypothetical protein
VEDGAADMKARARSKAIQGLLAGTLALFSSLPEADAIAGAPDPWGDDGVDDREGERGADDLQHHLTLLARLAQSPSSAVRVHVAEAAGALLGRERVGGLELLWRLSQDATAEVRAAAARGLADWIEHAAGPQRAAVESDWATSRSADARVALALALGNTTADWLTDLALGELAGDADPRVRRAALEAAREQLATSPGTYVALAAEHVADPDRRVRKSARHVLQRAELRGWAGEWRPTPTALRESRKRFRRAQRGDSVAWPARPSRRGADRVARAS